jgi:hypothetical protein
MKKHIGSHYPKSMIVVKTINGTVQPESQGAFKDKIRALPDGEHVVLIFPVGGTLDEIDKIVRWFSSLPPDYTDLQTLHDRYTYLSCLSYYFANDIGASALDKCSTEVTHSTQYAKAKRDLTANGTASQAAQTEAKIQTEKYAQEEATAKAIHELNTAQSSAIRGILSAMMMRISALKSEREFNQRGDSFPQNK